jgi:hypothetical protein
MTYLEKNAAYGRELTEAELETIAGGDASSPVKSALGGLAGHIVSGAGAVESLLGPIRQVVDTIKT